MIDIENTRFGLRMSIKRVYRFESIYLFLSFFLCDLGYLGESFSSLEKA